jgi:hypothetical protein
VATAHAITWERLRGFLLKYFLLDVHATASDISVAGVSAAGSESLNDLISHVIVPQAANHLVATQMEFTMQHVYGGTKFRLATLAPPASPQDRLIGRYLPRGVEIKNALLKDPRGYDEHMRDLRAWREEFEVAFTRRRTNDPDFIVEQYRRSWDAISADAEQIRGALLNVERIHDIQKVLDAMLNRLDSETIGSGGIDVPFDTRVVSVFASAGEHLAEGRPVMSVQERFRCKARAFVTSQEVSDLRLIPMSVWKVELNEQAEAAPSVSYVCIVGSIEPEKADLWVINMELLAVIQPSVEGVSNLPEVLPLSNRYLDPVVPGITEDVLNAVEQTFPICGTGTVLFVERLN